MNIKDFSIPKTAGCYLFKDDRDQIIYVGKSKFLPKRVTSYFQKNHTCQKTIKLVTEINSVDFISTESENEALVLEEDLIKLYKPKWNIKGKDDRTIRSLLQLGEGDWKKIDLVFPHQQITGEILAEFTSGQVARECQDILGQLFILRSCSYNLTLENIEAKKFKPCLDYHIGKCQAPCIGLASRIEYLDSIKAIREIFNFNFSPVEKKFKKQMKWHSDGLEFEKAAVIKNKLELLARLKGLIKPLEVVKKRKTADDIKQKLGLKFTPIVIDAFDNSHTSGVDVVCGMVRFTLFDATKNEWRKFNIKEGSGADDLRSFHEVLRRRFKRLIEEKLQLPNLVIIDGGRTQLSVALAIIKEFDLSDKLDLISISKGVGHKPRTIHLTSGEDVEIDKFFELGHISNEVHRFSLHTHRVKRSKSLFGK
jgi:excinuclease ABC subunit C